MLDSGLGVESVAKTAIDVGVGVAVRRSDGVAVGVSKNAGVLVGVPRIPPLTVIEA